MGIFFLETGGGSTTYKQIQYTGMLQDIASVRRMYCLVLLHVGMLFYPRNPL